MGEADWWLCAHCQSLNNLSAGKCYSCRRSKPKNEVRATEFLGYYPIESWDGKITMRQLLPSEMAPEAPVAVVKPPPIREPVRRDTLAVAPRPPEGARISYRETAPPPAVPPPPPYPVGPGPSPVSAVETLPLAPPPPMAQPPLAVPPPPLPYPPPVLPPPPLMAGPPAPAVAAASLGPPPPSSVAPAAPTVPDPHPDRMQRLVGVGPAPPPSVVPPATVAYVAQHEAELRSHWQDLLNVPTSSVDRTGTVGASVDQAGVDERTGRRHDRFALHRAMSGAQRPQATTPSPMAGRPEAQSPAPAPGHPEAQPSPAAIRPHAQSQPTAAPPSQRPPAPADAPIEGRSPTPAVDWPETDLAQRSPRQQDSSTVPGRFR